MSQLVPNRFLFDFEFPLRYRAQTPRIAGALADWSDAELLPDLGAIDGAARFGEVWACWNDEGIAVACRVEGKKKALQCDPKAFWKGDNLRLCTDMRDTRNVRRATRHCQQFYLLPTGGRGGAPVAASAKLQRARENAPDVPPGAITIAAQVESGSYQLEAHIPAGALSGFDPAEHARIGFYYILEDRELGQQYLTVGDDLQWHIDPSTWPTAVLTR
ncbi:MAG TPA: hypothetical protein P5572_14910 [Phycisphaerae bacterium]|nr:hypothetical protein [Phycisphaerales bacterium]HRX86308.1 hypothetical protein [Phycisphaerae bacterium]